jgi:hypothetical protein
MRLETFLRAVGPLPCFDLPLAEQVIGKPRRQIVTQLSRWISGGHLIPLRRGLYSVSEGLRKAPLSPLQVANELYRPSYLSGLWALGYYGIIPERVVLFTSVTTRVTRRFVNTLGEFAYSNIRKDLFRDFSKRTIDGAGVWIADPEKALLDHWHLHSGEWSPERMTAMRFQSFEMIDTGKLGTMAARFPPRVRRAVAAWEAVRMEAEEE